MPRPRPRQTENDREQRRLQRDEERSIATFTQTTRDFQRVTGNLADVVSSLQSVVTQMGRTNNSSGGSGNTPPGRGGGRRRGFRGNASFARDTQAGINRFERDAGRLGFQRIQRFTNDVFGKRSAQRMTRSMARFSGYINPRRGGGRGGFGGGMMGRAASGLGSVAGGLLRAAGPVGAIIGGLKMAFDFWDSGGFAKLTAGIKMATKKGSMFGPQGI